MRLAPPSIGRRGQPSYHPDIGDSAHRGVVPGAVRP